MRYLWLIRHAKTSEAAAGQSDHQRVLSERGQRDSKVMTPWLSSHDKPAEWVWTSTATRAVATAQYVADAFSCPIVEEESLYLAAPQALMDVIRTTPPEIENVAVVAHNPGLTQLCNLLTSDSVTDNLVTFGSALFGTDADWSHLTYSNNYFISIKSPKTVSPVS